MSNAYLQDVSHHLIGARVLAKDYEHRMPRLVAHLEGATVALEYVRRENRLLRHSATNNANTVNYLRKALKVSIYYAVYNVSSKTVNS